MVANLALGKYGEDLACEFLKSQGYQILKRNFREKYGEIDIIAREKETLVFVEVKTMVSDSDLDLKPEDQLSSAKLKKFSRICLSFANKYQNLVNNDFGWRMDVVAIEIIGNDYKIRHYENIV